MARANYTQPLNCGFGGRVLTVYAGECDWGLEAIGHHRQWVKRKKQ
ncbi:hypothetical protein [Salinivibrio sp. ES.052]|nr:hypothetical protein [Salinivibrio sp. ES.052]